jgi:hypothetical protein
VRANGVDFVHREWLYDVTWLQYSRGYESGLDNRLIDVYLVAECEWGTSPDVKYDFEKLLQARASVRLMIYGDFQQYPDSRGDGVAKRLAGYVRTSTAPAPRTLGCWPPGKKAITPTRDGCSGILRSGRTAKPCPIPEEP